MPKKKAAKKKVDIGSAVTQAISSLHNRISELEKDAGIESNDGVDPEAGDEGEEEKGLIDSLLEIAGIGGDDE